MAWDVKLPDGLRHGDLLAKNLAQLYITERHPFWDDPDFTPKPLTRWQRLKFWWSEHWPRVHFGPCDHSDCW